MTDPTRREFIEKVCVGAAGAVTAGYSATAGGYPANETIRVGVIGCGGRAFNNLVPKTLALPGTKLVAACDVYTGHRERMVKLATDAGDKIDTTRRHEDIIDRKDVDAVIVATPDHWHVPISVAACESGKDVYCEKPLTHKLNEGERIIAAQNDNKRVLQVGMQQRSFPQFKRAKEIIRSGRLGNIHKVHMTWNRNDVPFRKPNRNITPKEFDWKRFLGNAKERPFDPYPAIQAWRWYWDFGAGILGDLMVHWLDAVNWALDLPMPSRAVSSGDNFATKGVWETPDTIQTILEYPEQRMQAHFEGTFVNQHTKAGVTFMGTDATLYVDRGRYEFTPEPRRDAKPEAVILGTEIKGADFDLDGTSLHIANWLECMRTREKPIAPAEAGVLSAAGAQFGNQAFPGYPG